MCPCCAVWRSDIAEPLEKVPRGEGCSRLKLVGRVNFGTKEIPCKAPEPFRPKAAL